VENYARALQVFEQAINDNPSEILWVSYLQFLKGKLSSLESSDYGLVDYLKEGFISVATRLDKGDVPVGHINSVAIIAVPVFLQLGFVAQACGLAVGCTKVNPSDSRCWKLRIELEIKLAIPNEDIMHHFEEAVKLSSPDVSLWVMYMQWLITSTSLPALSSDIVEEAYNDPEGNNVINVATRCLKRVFSTLNVAEYSALKNSLLDTIFFHYGIDSARAFIQLSLTAPPNTLEYYKHCIALEDAQVSCSWLTLQPLYEQAVQEYGSLEVCEDVWLQYIQMETQQLRMDRAGDIYWRAKQTLESSEGFIAKFTGLTKIK